MWHPFDIMPDALTVAPEIRNAKPSDSCVFTFGEKVMTYFKDKSGKTEQWPPMLDAQPGLRIARKKKSSSLELEITQTWKLDYIRELKGTMSCKPDGWRSPLEWNFTRTFTAAVSRPSNFAPVKISGRWENGKMIQTFAGEAAQDRRAEQVDVLACTYSLLADFPGLSGSMALLNDGLIFAPSAAVHKCTAALHQRPPAAGLTGYMILSGVDQPVEYWVNEHGAVIYVCSGTTRVLILKNVETLS